MSAGGLFRVDFRPLHAETLAEHTGRVESVSATGCTIRSRNQPEPGAELELRLYLPGRAWPIRVDHATVTWGYWDSFCVYFLSLPAPDREQLAAYLAAQPTPVTV